MITAIKWQIYIYLSTRLGASPARLSAFFYALRGSESPKSGMFAAAQKDTPNASLTPPEGAPDPYGHPDRAVIWWSAHNPPLSGTKCYGGMAEKVREVYHFPHHEITQCYCGMAGNVRGTHYFPDP